MLLVAIVFVLGAGAVLGGYYAMTSLPAMLEQRRLDRRLKDVSLVGGPAEGELSLVNRPTSGGLPGVERALAATRVGPGLSRLIEQSGLQTTPSSDILITLVLGAGAGFLASLFVPLWYAWAAAAIAGAALPIVFILNRRSARMHAFEEQFPEALDLCARALRAGHAFQTALGMVADEMKPPVGPEFKKTFDQQNFGLPLRDALNQMAERMPILDVRFFASAVLIQRETGGNLSEILDNLGHVVRERFKIRRQVRVHTAHGRFTAFVLLSLPAALALVLTFLSPEHMEPLLYTRVGQTLIVAAIVMQTIGLVWIRQVIKIEV
jgi:tight adherence protein B